MVMCQACRGLIDASSSTCPLCGRESVPSLPARASDHTGTDHFVSRLILTINIALFVLMVIADMRAGTESALTNPSTGVFYDFGGRYVTSINEGQWWRLITPNFLHIGVLHLMFNSFALYQVGPLVEETYGSQKFIFIYLGTGVVSNIASYAFEINGAGASGAIFGLIGLMAVFGYRMGGEFGRSLMRQMLIWAAFGIMMGFGVGADNVAHIGGMITGAALGFALKPEEPATSRAAWGWNAAAILCAAVVTASFVMVAINYDKARPAFANSRSVEMVIEYFNSMSEADRSLIESYNSFADAVNAKDSKVDTAPAKESAARGISKLDTLPNIGEEAAAHAARLKEAMVGLSNTIDQFGKDKDWKKVQDGLKHVGDTYEQFRQGYEAWLPGFLESHGLRRRRSPSPDPSS